jgi:predicted ATPase
VGSTVRERSTASPSVFLSYRRDDTRGYAGRLHDVLGEQFGPEQVFIDVDGLAPGIDFAAALDERVSKADVVLVLIGPRWASASRPDGSLRLNERDDYVRAEIEAALRGELPIIPVLLADARMPDAADVPESLRPVLRYNAIEISDARWRFDVGRLTSAIEQLVSERGERAPSEATGAEARLPPLPTPTIGREREIGTLVGLLERPDVRLVSIIGPGGIGKTRLALNVAARLGSSFEAGVRFVDLSGIVDAENVPSAIAQAIGQGDDPAELVGERQMLLVIDNFEHVIAAADVIARLLDRCPNLKLLVTSRVRLDLRAEHDFAVPPLEPNEAVDLFVAAARAIDPSFAPDVAVGEICERLDRLPLAIELAAARTGVLSTESIRDRLDRRLSLLTSGPRDLPTRQRTLRATIQWSVDLLEPAPRELLARLAVFIGGFDLEAAEQIAEADLDALAALVDHNLVRREGDRYRILDTIREFAGELEAAGLDRIALEERHARYYADLAHRALAESGAHRVDDTRWLARFRLDYPNLRAAMGWFVARGEGPPLADFTQALYMHWIGVGQPFEGELWATEAVRLNPDIEPRDRMWLMAIQTEFPRYAGQIERAIGLKQGVLEFARGAGLGAYTGGLLHDLASLFAAARRFDDARAAAEESVALRRAMGLPRGIAHSLEGLAGVEREAGRLEIADKILDEIDALDPQKNELDGIEHLAARADVSRRLGRQADAEARFTEVYRRSVAVDYQAGLAQALIGLAETRLPADPRHAAMLIGAGMKVTDDAQYGMDLGARDRAVAAARATLEASDYADAIAAGRALTPQEVGELVDTPPAS